MTGNEQNSVNGPNKDRSTNILYECKILILDFKKPKTKLASDSKSSKLFQSQSLSNLNLKSVSQKEKSVETMMQELPMSYIKLHINTLYLAGEFKYNNSNSKFYFSALKTKPEKIFMNSHCFQMLTHLFFA